MGVAEESLVRTRVRLLMFGRRGVGTGGRVARGVANCALRVRGRADSCSTELSETVELRESSLWLRSQFDGQQAALAELRLFAASHVAAHGADEQAAVRHIAEDREFRAELASARAEAEE